MNLKQITERPTVIDNIHESCYRTSGILQQVLEMIDRGDSAETIHEVVDYLKESFEIDEQKGETRK